MPAIGPVYQPTTYNVGYEQQSSDWPQAPRRRRWWTELQDRMQSDECCRRSCIIAIGVIITFLLLLVVDYFISLIGGSSLLFGYDNTVHSIIIFIIIAVISTAFMVTIAFLSYRYARKRFYFWPFTRKESLARQMSSQGRSGQAMVLNPSTDFLVTNTQYGPVMEAPPAMHEEDETRNLMSNDTKELTEEHEDRIADTDPRIVLRPPGHRDDS